MTRAFAIVLAGGRSSRIGRPKATLPFGGVTLLERIVAELKRGFASVVVVAAPQADEPFRLALDGVRIVRDRIAYAGPVAALHAGLAAGTGDIAFTSSCDLPLLRVEVALRMAAMVEDFDAVIPRVGGRLQMLHAVYHRRCAEALAAMEARGERRLSALADRVKARIVEEAELKKIDPRMQSVFNVNTLEDYRTALEIAGQRNE